MNTTDQTPDPTTSSACPCGQNASYDQCCGRWHAGPLTLQAPDAESLMRSRYSAFVLGLNDYLLETWHPRTRPRKFDSRVPGLQWLGLEVRKCVQVDENRATVEFVARNKMAGRASRLHEISRFERIDGRWVYLDANGERHSRQPVESTG